MEKNTRLKYDGGGEGGSGEKHLLCSVIDSARNAVLSSFFSSTLGIINIIVKSYKHIDRDSGVC